MYDARPAAIRKRLDETAAKSREVFKKSHDEDARDAGARPARALLRRAGARARGRGCASSNRRCRRRTHQERWSRHFSEAGSKAAKEISDLVKDAKIKTPFVTAVAGHRVPGVRLLRRRRPRCRWRPPRGRILEWYGQFVREEKNLRGRLGRAGPTTAVTSRRSLAEVTAEVAKLYEERIQKAAAKARDIEELFRRWFPAADKGEEAMDRGEPGIGRRRDQSTCSSSWARCARPSRRSPAGSAPSTRARRR